MSALPAAERLVTSTPAVPEISGTKSALHTTLLALDSSRSCITCTSAKDIGSAHFQYRLASATACSSRLNTTSSAAFRVQPCYYQRACQILFDYGYEILHSNARTSRQLEICSHAGFMFENRLVVLLNSPQNHGIATTYMLA